MLFFLNSIVFALSTVWRMECGPSSRIAAFVWKMIVLIDHSNFGGQNSLVPWRLPIT